MMPKRRAVVKEPIKAPERRFAPRRTQADLVAQPLRLESAGDHLFTHAVEQGKS